MITHHGRASSFADPADIVRFHKWFRIYKDQGFSDDRAEKLAFKKGDNGVGCWDDSTVEGTGPSCALPPEDMEEKWGGSKETHWIEAKNKLVQVTIGDKSVVCVLKDRMPHKANIENSAIIDLNPDAVKALGQQFPLLMQCSWSWVD